jgi:protein-disulfide isomerase
MLKMFRNAGLGVLALGLLVAAPAFAQESDDDIRAEIEALKQGQKDIQRQLNDIKRMLQQQARKPAPRPGPQVKDVVFNVGSAEVKGEKSAQLTLIEFTDYQ